MKKENLRPYQMAQQLRSAANRCARLNADVAMLCEHALAAASWLENEADDIAKMTGSVTHNALMGRITPGCIIHETPNAEFSGRPKALSASPRGLPGYATEVKR